MSEPEPAEPMLSEPAMAASATGAGAGASFGFFLQAIVEASASTVNKDIAIRMTIPPADMLRALVRAAIVVAVISWRGSADAAPPDLRLPPGTRADASGQLVSGRGIRDTTDFLAKELSRRGIAVRQIGPTRVRGVELTRFISQTASTSWLAIHVLRTGGKTLIFFVPRPKA